MSEFDMCDCPQWRGGHRFQSGRCEPSRRRRRVPAPQVCPECHNNDPDACGRCIREAEELLRTTPAPSHDYLGWRDGGCSCSCGRRFDSVQEYDAHVTTPGQRADDAAE